MSPGPPPPPAAPPVPKFEASSAPPPAGKDRNQLLKQIQKGAKLKNVETVDKSAPVIEAPKNSSATQSTGGGGSSALPASGGAPQLGGLFAGGMPKLKSTKKSNEKLDSNGSSNLSNGNSGASASSPSKPAFALPARPGPVPGMVKPSPATTSAALTGPPPVSGRKPPAVPPPTMPKPAVSKEKLNEPAGPPLTMLKSPSAESVNRSQEDISRRSSVPGKRAPPPVPPSRPVQPAAPALSGPPSLPFASVAPPKVPPPVPNRTPVKTPPMERKAPAPPTPSRSQQAPAIPQISVVSSSSSSSQARQQQNAHGGSFESEGRWKFHEVGDLPQPRPFVQSVKIYHSGASTGTSIANQFSLTSGTSKLKVSPPAGRRPAPLPPVKKSNEALNRPMVPPR
ncbi:hypothetical protein MP228_008402 [Amoeboaphelidium protococcarum]|nr:hypothetical protein MP228_008402 [Amoeboaphelidium protococcarum]